MIKTIKHTVLGLLAVIILAAVGIVVLALTLDANLLKPVLHKVAREQGIELNIPGDIEWKFYPNLGLNLGVVRVGTLDGQQPLASITRAAVSVKLMPLLRDREILVNGIILDGLDVQFNIDKNGNTAWSQVGPQDKATNAVDEPAPPAEEQALPTLEIESIDITRLSLHYNNAQTGDAIQVTDTRLSSQNFSLTGTPFALSLSSTIKYNDQPTAQIAWNGPVSLDLDAEAFSTDSARVVVRLADAEVSLDVNNKTHWGEPFTSTGALKLYPTALPPLFKALNIPPPETQNPNALKEVSAQLTYAVDDEMAKITDATLRLDQTILKGELTMSNFEQPQIVTRWQGNTLPLDDYLPPQTEEEAVETAQEPPTPLPTQALQALNLDATIGFDRIQAKGLEIKQPKLHVTAKQGLIKLENLAMKIADGSVVGRGQLDARQPQAQLALQLDTENVKVGELLTAFADIDNIHGSASASIQATSVGDTDQALIDNLDLTAVAKSQSLSLTPFNIEEQFCKALALVQQEVPKSVDWPDMTKLQPVTMQLKLREQTLKLDQLSAEIANLTGAATGQFNLATGDFNVPFKLSLGEFATTLPGCLPIKEKWRKRALPIRCKGNLSDIGPTTCLPDTKLIADLVKDRVTAEAKERLDQEKQQLKQKAEQKQDQVEQKLEDKTREVINKELGGEQTQEIEGKVKGALDRFKGREPSTKK